MRQEQFSQIYLRNEQQIARRLQELQIYDEDRLHDTYIALYEAAPTIGSRRFAETFVKYYRTLQRRANDQAAHFIPCSPSEMVEQFDRPDESDTEYREQVAQRVDELIEEYRHHPFAGERNHQRAVRILQLYRSGLTPREIAKRIRVTQRTVELCLQTMLKKLRLRYSKQEH